MKKTFIVFMSMVIMAAFVSSASALDRAPKKSGSDSTKETTEIKEITKEEAKRKARKSSFSEKKTRTVQNLKRTVGEKPEKAKARSQTRESKEKYDYFIDRNNNGIDDRLEKEAKAKKAKKPEPAKKPEAARKNTSRPPDKAPAKINPVPKPAKKVKEEKVNPKRKAPGIKDGETKKERTR
ncbi:MAG: hypothetical protein WBC98_07320 [Candidatus Zixiibacteriota bacterium]